MKYELLVSSMKCSGCVDTVINKLKENNQLEIIESSLSKENIIIDYQDDIEQLVESFNNLKLTYKIVDCFLYEENNVNSLKTKTRENKEYKDLMNRLKRIEGQIRGLQRMLDNDAYCTDIIVQVSAVTSALNSFNRQLLSNHIKSCVINDIRSGNEETVDELIDVLGKLMK